ncbi:2-oxoacid:acceptor oxidoreductase, gamma subunit, pyruvate/2-ketoisovalerate family [Aciduliprofundum sp. MAR08-339]|nr:2-oxoacid:acceptor oxidoreductase, gamma subunit, pyruvate/2-ketoisovalerate family [Aciduliprofundum sp. MAR08-339]
MGGIIAHNKIKVFMVRFKVEECITPTMYEVRFHGRGGQGAVTAANILAIAAVKQGFYAQSFPYFGVERRGAPVQAFTRIDDKKIDIRMNVYNPDAVVVLDPSLMDVIDVTEGLKEGGIIVINTSKKPEEFELKNFKIATVNATEIALRHHLGSQAAPIVNTSILGAYARAVGNVKVEYVVEAIRENAPAKKEENALAAKEAYEQTVLGW